MFKDFHRAPVHVNTIPVEALEGVKDWLDSVDIAYTEGPLNLNWTTIMKTVVSDPYGFFADGGWSFLAAESDSEGSEEEEESAFELSDSELAASESSEEDSEYDEDASADGSEEDFSGDEESGEDWDELEKKAKRQDKEARVDEDDRGTKRKR